MNLPVNFSNYCKDNFTVGRNVIIHKVNRDNANTAESNAYMEVCMLAMLNGGNSPLILLQINSSLGNHIVGTTEWHDMLWASNWVVERELEY